MQPIGAKQRVAVQRQRPQQKNLHDINIRQEESTSQQDEQGTKRKLPEEGDRDDPAAKRFETNQHNFQHQQRTVALKVEEPPNAP